MSSSIFDTASYKSFIFVQLELIHLLQTELFSMTAEEAQVVENEEVEEIQLYNIPGAQIIKSSLVKLLFLVLQMLKSAQQEHGLRHRDYQRYRRYCNNRCRRIRKFLKFRQGEKKRVVPRKVTEYEAKQNALFVHLCIMGIEQDWAYSMELKVNDFFK